MRGRVRQYLEGHGAEPIGVAAALAKVEQGDEPLLLEPPRKRKERERNRREPERGERRPERGFDDGERPPFRRDARGPDSRASRRAEHKAEAGMETYRIAVGHVHEVQPGNIVGAIANEAGLDAKDIGRINIFDDFSTVDLPQGMPKDVFLHLKRVWVSGQQLKISREGDAADQPPTSRKQRGADRVDGNKGAKPPKKKQRHRDRKNKGAPARKKT